MKRSRISEERIIRMVPAPWSGLTLGSSAMDRPGRTIPPSGNAYGNWRPNAAALASAVCTFCSNAKAL